MEIKTLFLPTHSAKLIIVERRGLKFVCGNGRECRVCVLFQFVQEMYDSAYDAVKVKKGAIVKA
jgi:hypothetical protein